MSLQYIPASLLTACLVLAITAPARAEQSRALHVVVDRDAVACPTSHPVKLEAPSAPALPSDLDQLRKVVFDLADEAVSGLMSATIHLPFDVRVTPAAAVSWVKGLFGGEESEPMRNVAAVPAQEIQNVSLDAIAPGAVCTPFFVHAKNDDGTARVKAVLRLDDHHGFAEDLRWEDLRDEHAAAPSSGSSFEIRVPALHVRERAQIDSLLRVLHAG